MNYSNPKVAFFHVVFKAAALVWYILSTWLINEFVIDFVICVLLLALDFWTVKNVSGRILVGLRWWNDIDDNGDSVWRFESLDQEAIARLNNKDSWLFWWTLFLTPLAWLFLGVMALIKLDFDWLLIIAVALVLNGANIYGYIKCRRDAKSQIQAFAKHTVADHVASSLQTAFAV
eukprot:SM000112S23986  [mRNA]  locus=s112:270439:272024:+ [translate_table: standard]